MDAGEADWAWPKKAARPWKSLLLPVLEGVVVALGAVEADAEEGPGDAAGEALGVGLLLLGVAGDGEEIGRRLVGPEAVGRDQVADDLVVGAVRVELRRSARSRSGGGGRR